MINAMPALVTAAARYEFQAAHVRQMLHLLAPVAKDMVVAQLDARADPAARGNAGVTVPDGARDHGPDLPTIVQGVPD